MSTDHSDIPGGTASAPGARRTLLLVRHGLPDYRTRKPGDEPPGPPLSDIGFEQARQAIPVVRRFRPQAIHASPLARARQTAAVLGSALAIAPRVASDLKEWHRTEDLFGINQRHVRWLHHWLAHGEDCAVAVGHGSGLLALLREALYLPHFGWWQPGRAEFPMLATGDRFEVSMASVFAIEFTPDKITARLIHHPVPRIMQVRRGRVLERFVRPVPGENRVAERPNFGRLIGYPAPS